MYLEDKRLNPGTASPQRAAREALIALLRNRSRWPEGFTWDYADCRSCAMGLFLRWLGLTVPEPDIRFDWHEERRAIGSALGLPFGELNDEGLNDISIFYRAHAVVGVDPFSVSPEHVAALLEAAPYA